MAHLRYVKNENQGIQMRDQIDSQQQVEPLSQSQINAHSMFLSQLNQRFKGIRKLLNSSQTQTQQNPILIFAEQILRYISSQSIRIKCLINEQPSIFNKVSTQLNQMSIQLLKFDQQPTFKGFFTLKKIYIQINQTFPPNNRKNEVNFVSYEKLFFPQNKNNLQTYQKIRIAQTKTKNKAKTKLQKTKTRTSNAQIKENMKLQQKRSLFIQTNNISFTQQTCKSILPIIQKTCQQAKIDKIHYNTQRKHGEILPTSLQNKQLSIIRLTQQNVQLAQVKSLQNIQGVTQQSKNVIEQIKQTYKQDEVKAIKQCLLQQPRIIQGSLHQLGQQAKKQALIQMKQFTQTINVVNDQNIKQKIGLIFKQSEKDSSFIEGSVQMVQKGLQQLVQKSKQNIVVLSKELQNQELLNSQSTSVLKQQVRQIQMKKGVNQDIINILKQQCQSNKNMFIDILKKIQQKKINKQFSKQKKRVLIQSFLTQMKLQCNNIFGEANGYLQLAKKSLNLSQQQMDGLKQTLILIKEMNVKNLNELIQIQQINKKILHRSDSLQRQVKQMTKILSQNINNGYNQILTECKQHYKQHFQVQYAKIISQIQKVQHSQIQIQKNDKMFASIQSTIQYLKQNSNEIMGFLQRIQQKVDEIYDKILQNIAITQTRHVQLRNLNETTIQQINKTIIQTFQVQLKNQIKNLLGKYQTNQTVSTKILEQVNKFRQTHVTKQYYNAMMKQMTNKLQNQFNKMFEQVDILNNLLESNNVGISNISQLVKNNNKTSEQILNQFHQFIQKRTLGEKQYRAYLKYLFVQQSKFISRKQKNNAIIIKEISNQLHKQKNNYSDKTHKLIKQIEVLNKAVESVKQISKNNELNFQTINVLLETIRQSQILHNKRFQNVQQIEKFVKAQNQISQQTLKQIHGLKSMIKGKNQSNIKYFKKLHLQTSQNMKQLITQFYDDLSKHLKTKEQYGLEKNQLILQKQNLNQQLQRIRTQRYKLSQTYEEQITLQRNVLIAIQSALNLNFSIQDLDFNVVSNKIRSKINEMTNLQNKSVQMVTFVNSLKTILKVNNQKQIITQLVLQLQKNPKLQAQLRNLKLLFDQCSKNLKQAENKQRQLQYKLNEIISKINNNEKQKVSIQSRKGELERGLMEKSNVITQLNSKIQYLQGIQQQFNQQKIQSAALQNQLNNSQRAKQQMQQSLKKSQIQIQKFNNLKISHEVNKTKVQQRQRQFNDSTAKVQKLETSIMQQKHERNLILQQKKRFQLLYTEKLTQLNNVMKNIKSLQNKIQLLQIQLNNATSKSIHKTSNDQTMFQTQLNAKQKQVLSLNTQIITYQSQVQRLKMQVVRIMSLKGQSDINVSRLQNQIKMNNEKVYQLTNQIQEKKRQINGLQQKVMSLQSQSQIIKGKEKMLVDKNKQITKQLQTSKQQKQKLQNQLKILREKYTKQESSVKSTLRQLQISKAQILKIQNIRVQQRNLMKDQSVKLKQNVNIYERSIKQKQDLLKQRQIQLTKLRQRLQVIQTQLKQYSVKQSPNISQLTGQYIKAKQQLQISHTKASQYESQISELKILFQKSKVNLEQEKVLAKKSIQQLKQNIKVIHEKDQLLIQQKKILEIVKEQFSKEKENLINDKKAIQTQIQKSKQQYIKLKQQMRKMGDEVIKYKQQFQKQAILKLQYLQQKKAQQSKYNYLQQIYKKLNIQKKNTIHLLKKRKSLEFIIQSVIIRLQNQGVDVQIAIANFKRIKDLKENRQIQLLEFIQTLYLTYAQQLSYDSSQTFSLKKVRAGDGGDDSGDSDINDDMTQQKRKKIIQQQDITMFVNNNSKSLEATKREIKQLILFIKIILKALIFLLQGLIKLSESTLKCITVLKSLQKNVNNKQLNKILTQCIKLFELLYQIQQQILHFSQYKNLQHNSRILKKMNITNNLILQVRKLLRDIQK